MLRLSQLNRPRVFFILVLITTVIYYFQHIRTAEFVFEDSQWTSFSGWNIKSLLNNIPNNSLALYSFYIFPKTPQVQHGVNLLIHIINSLILALLINEWNELGWIVGSLFLVNPLSIQAIAYVSGRSELLGLTELLILLWFASVDLFSTLTRWIGLILCATAMLFTKATLIAFTPILLIWIYMSDYYTYWYEQWLKRLDLELFAIVSISVLCLTPNIIAHIHSNIPFFHWFSSQTTASWMLMYSALTGRNLSIDHAWWSVNFSIQLFSVAALILVACFMIAYFYSPMIFGLGWWLIAILPRLLVPSKLGWIREHHAYIPLVGLCISLSSLIQLFDEESYEVKHS